MGTRKKRERQEPLWYGSELPEAPGHPFYSRLNEVLDKAGFDKLGWQAQFASFLLQGNRPARNHGKRLIPREPAVKTNPSVVRSISAQSG